MSKKTYVTYNKDFVTSGSGRTARIKDEKGNTVAKGTGNSSREAINSAKKKLYGK